MTEPIQPESVEGARRRFRLQWVFVGLFVLMITGIADPVTSALIDFQVSNDLDPFSYFLLDLFTSDSLARVARGNDFGGFFLYCIIVSGGLTISIWGAWVVYKKTVSVLGAQ